MSKPTVRAQRIKKTKDLIRSLFFVCLYTTLAFLFDFLTSPSYQEEGAFLVLFRNLALVLTYMVVLPRAPDFWQILAFASIITWASVILFVPSAVQDWQSFRTIYVQQTRLLVDVCQKFLAFRLIQLVLYW